MIINTNEPTCPTCGGTLEAISHFGVEEMNTGTIAMSVVGMCDHCHNTYEWVEYYSYMGHADVKPSEAIKARAI